MVSPSGVSGVRVGVRPPVFESCTARGYLHRHFIAAKTERLVSQHVLTSFVTAFAIAIELDLTSRGKLM